MSISGAVGFQVVVHRWLDGWGGRDLTGAVCRKANVMTRKLFLPRNSQKTLLFQGGQAVPVRRPPVEGKSGTLPCLRSRCSLATFLAMVWSLAGGAITRAARVAGERDGLVLEYRFDGSAADSSSNQRDGTAHGKPQFVPGKVGLSLIHISEPTRPY